MLRELRRCAELGHGLCPGSTAGSCGEAGKQNSP